MHWGAWCWIPLLRVLNEFSTSCIRIISKAIFHIVSQYPSINILKLFIDIIDRCYNTHSIELIQFWFIAASVHGITVFMEWNAFQTLKLRVMMVHFLLSHFWLIKKSSPPALWGMEEDRGERACLYKVSHALRLVLCLRDNGCRWLAQCRCGLACNGRLCVWDKSMHSHGVYFSLTHTASPGLDTEPVAQFIGLATFTGMCTKSYQIEGLCFISSISAAQNDRTRVWHGQSLVLDDGNWQRSSKKGLISAVMLVPAHW